VRIAEQQPLLFSPSAANIPTEPVDTAAEPTDDVKADTIAASVRKSTRRRSTAVPEPAVAAAAEEPVVVRRSGRTRKQSTLFE
jgi:hypothetical protein